jgi:DNA-damage-inducible protein J
MGNFTIRIDDAVKKDAEVLFEKLGMSVSGAVNIFFRQAIREQGLPFQPMITKDIDGFSQYDAARIDHAINQLKSGGGRVLRKLIED